MISTVDNIQTRVSEIDYVFLPTIRHDIEISKENVTEILQFKDKFDQICLQIDSLELLVSRVKVDLSKIEDQMDIASDELAVPKKGLQLNSFLKSMNPFLKPRDPNASNIGPNGSYNPPDIFRARDFFHDENKN